MNQKEIEDDKWTKLFSLLEFSEEEQKAAKAYLSGEEGIDVLEKIGFLDLSVINSVPETKLFYELVRKKQTNG